MTALVDASSDLSGDAVLRAAAGDREALGALYRRYAHEVFDLAARLLRDRDRAVDIVRATFVEAWQQVERTEPSEAGARQLLLGTAARLSVADAGRKHRTHIEERADTDLAATEARLAAGATSPMRSDGTDLALEAEAVWAAAAALDPVDYAVLDLWVRRELSLTQVAEALGRGDRRTARRAERLRRSIDDTVTALSVARHGRENCPTLRQLLDDIPAHSPHGRIREVVAGHLDDGCITCAVHRSSVVEPASLLGALAVIPFPDGREAALWPAIRESLAGPRVIARHRRERRSHRMTAAAAALAVLVLVGVAIAMPRGNDPEVAAIDDPADARSTSHRTGQDSDQNRITVEWSRHPRATGYSVEWSRGRSVLPDQKVDLPGTATSARSPELQPGTWWFSLRTRGEDNAWTSTVVLGPFVVVEREAETPEATTTTVEPTTTSSTVSASTTTTRRITSTTAAPVTTTTSSAPPEPRPRPTTTTTAPPTTTTTAPPTTTTAPPETTTTTSPPDSPPGD